MALAGVLLAAAWPWCWNATGVATAGQRRGQELTAIRYAQRTFCADARRAVGLAAVPASGAELVTLLAVDESTGSTESVTYGFDAGRGVVWRKSASTYLLERVAGCRFEYFTGAGVAVTPAIGGPLSADQLEHVRRVRMVLTVRGAAGRSTTTSCTATFRAFAGV